jgi:hypothetical protein
MTGGPFSRSRRRLILSVSVVGAVIVVASFAVVLYESGRHGPSGYSNGTPISALFEANVSGNSTTSGGNNTNISVTVVNGSVPLSSLQIIIVPKDGAAPATSWVVALYANASTSTPVGFYRLANASHDDLNTTMTGYLAAGMVFSVWVPTGINLAGGYVAFFSTISQTSQIVWIR